ncbi:MAG: EAL domain-containing protein [Lysobacteraceae bacterium]|nr:MAG: EAL domain-containing protein [Xanthomonadaceae bacterium]
MALILALLVLVLAGIVLGGHRRREREQREHLLGMREREEKLRLALWASGEFYWQYDLERHEMESVRIEPGRRDDLDVRMNLDSDHKIHPDDVDHVVQRLRAYVSGQAPMFLSEHRVRDEAGDWQWMRARGRAVGRNQQGRITKIAGTARDVTASRAQERERRIATEVTRHMAEAVVVLDEEFNFVTVNPAFTRISGYSLEDVVGHNASVTNSEQHDAAFYEQSRQAMREQGFWNSEMWQRRKDGREFLCSVQTNAILEPGTQRRLYVLVATDITDRRRIEQELRYLANYDTLTNLPNRTLLAERLSRAIVRARRQGTCVALLFLDLDRFKDINDSLGHASGDRILRIAAQRLQQAAGPSHTVARIGGDEFTVVLEDLAHAGEADLCAQRVIDAFDQPLLIDDRQEIVITPSIGISLYPDHAQVPTDLLKHADTAMYQAKAAGRHTYMRYTEAMDSHTRRRAGLIASLRRVVERDELRLVYQPQLSLADGRIQCVEALLRWHSAEHGEVPPAQFIPLAEESGMIVAIGEWVLREACNTLADWHQAGLGGMAIAVNVSAVQLLRSDLPRTVERILRETGIAPAQLELELTESVLMANAGLAAERLQTFRRIGVSIAVDDFGTGYSSLAYLRRLPITTLKIDKAFIDDLGRPGDSEDAAITTTVIAMARSLGLNVVAEGVETAEQLAFLRQHHCDVVQGYWLSPPLQAPQCLEFIREWPGHAGFDPLPAVAEAIHAAP